MRDAVVYNFLICPAVYYGRAFFMKKKYYSKTYQTNPVSIRIKKKQPVFIADVIADFVYEKLINLTKYLFIFSNKTIKNILNQIRQEKKIKQSFKKKKRLITQDHVYKKNTNKIVRPRKKRTAALSNTAVKKIITVKSTRKRKKAAKHVQTSKIKSKKRLSKVNSDYIKRFGLALFIIAGIELISVGVISVDNYFKTNKTFILAKTSNPETTEIKTDFYFENKDNLPKEAFTNTDYTFSFTVHNQEDKQVVYPYEVYIDIDGYKMPLDEGSISLQQDESQTISETYTIPLPIIKAKVVVYLKNINKSIDFPINGSE